MITIYHNPRCGKSREGLAFLETTNQSFEIVKYLETPLSFNELEIIIQKLGISPMQLIRTKEAIWIEKYKGKNLHDNEIIQSMINYPILIERPIVVKGNRAIVARPFKKINEIL